MIIHSSEPEVKILVDMDPVKTYFKEWASQGHFSRTIAKGPDTTTWIWNLDVDAHNFDRYTTWLSDPTHIKPSLITTLLYCNGALVFAMLMLFAGWFHYHKADPKLACFQDVKSMLNHHLTRLLDLGSLSWESHQIHVSLSINQFLDARVDPTSP
ncbi:hypothetical protein MKW92_021663 [Papaver armeniacum]|nr:hypothetical protein MKW92_021663 [Papaver armeniacum]